MLPVSPDAVEDPDTRLAPASEAPGNMSKPSGIFTLGCNCSGSLGVAHPDCALHWFMRARRSPYCEVCGGEVKNVIAVVLNLRSRHSPPVGSADNGERQASRGCTIVAPIGSGIPQQTTGHLSMYLRPVTLAGTSIRHYPIPVAAPPAQRASSLPAGRTWSQMISEHEAREAQAFLSQLPPSSLAEYTSVGQQPDRDEGDSSRTTSDESLSTGPTPPSGATTTAVAAANSETRINVGASNSTGVGAAGGGVSDTAFLAVFVLLFVASVTCFIAVFHMNAVLVIPLALLFTSAFFLTFSAGNLMGLVVFNNFGFLWSAIVYAGVALGIMALLNKEGSSSFVAALLMGITFAMTVVLLGGFFLFDPSTGSLRLKMIYRRCCVI
eukprot:jgi/Mesvir1/5903/Mv00673-RA.1